MTDITVFVNAEPLFETHSHQLGFDAHQWETKTFEELLGYAVADLEVAAAGETVAGARAPFDVWPFVRTTGYGQAVEMGAQALFGLAYTEHNAAALTDAVRRFCRGKTAAQIHAELYERANIIASINDMFWIPPGRVSAFDSSNYLKLTRFAARFELRDHTLIGATAGSVKAFEERADVSVHSLDELDRALDDYAAQLVATGRLAAIKIGQAYGRDLCFAEVEHAHAAALFDAAMRGDTTVVRPLGDYLFHRLLERARMFNLPVQIHTGYLAGTGQDIRQGDPRPLVPVFQTYRDIRFDIFHAGWPWTSFLGAVGKEFPNVWLDLCWMWAMNPIQAERTLDEWLSAVPSNKLFAFGADIQSPFAEMGYALQARQGIAHVLERKRSRGEYDVPTAQFVARRIMHANATHFFGTSAA